VPEYVGITMSKQGEKIIWCLSSHIVYCYVDVCVMCNGFLSRIYYGIVFIRDGNTYFSFFVCVALKGPIELERTRLECFDP
jgi:hypothetical protein